MFFNHFVQAPPNSCTVASLHCICYHICSKAITAKSTSRYFHFFHCDFHNSTALFLMWKQKFLTVYFMSMQPNYCKYSIAAALIINCFLFFFFLFLLKHSKQWVKLFVKVSKQLSLNKFVYFLFIWLNIIQFLTNSQLIHYYKLQTIIYCNCKARIHNLSRSA